MTKHQRITARQFEQSMSARGLPTHGKPYFHVYDALLSLDLTPEQAMPFVCMAYDASEYGGRVGG